jgi:hypothetical protein
MGASAALGAAAAAAAAAAIPALATVVAIPTGAAAAVILGTAAAAAYLGNKLGPTIFEGLQGIVDFVTDAFLTGARTRRLPRDPLAIDLDGDGIKTVGVGANPILFDHNADGIRTGTGWVTGDDAWLVLDRNANGTIDSGRELFGVDTLLSGTPGIDAVYAPTGFEALRALDANADNVFNAQDSAFTQVRLWRDLNQDGISQASELTTLAAQNIVAISLNASTTTINLGNGNTVSGTATVTRGNGSTTHVDAVGVAIDTTAGNLNLTNNPFYREFTTTVPLTTAARALPDMQGSGWVRDLREAMSLGTPQAQALTTAVQQFAAAATREAQQTQLVTPSARSTSTSSTTPPQSATSQTRWRRTKAWCSMPSYQVGSRCPRPWERTTPTGQCCWKRTASSACTSWSRPRAASSPTTCATRRAPRSNAAGRTSRR